MIDSHCLPSWIEIFERSGLQPPRRGRTRCPLCGASERSIAFSCHEERGFHCFRCGRRGDKISFIQQLRACDFKDALRWFGLEQGRAPKPDPVHAQAQAIREKLRTWKRRVGREARDLLAARHELEACGIERLEVDRDDEAGWQLLAAAFKGCDRDEHIADALAAVADSDDESLLGLYGEFREAYDQE